MVILLLNPSAVYKCVRVKQKPFSMFFATDLLFFKLAILIRSSPVPSKARLLFHFVSQLDTNYTHRGKVSLK